MYSFVDLKTFVSLEIGWSNISAEKFYNKNVIYHPLFGLSFIKHTYLFSLDKNENLGLIQTLIPKEFPKLTENEKDIRIKSISKRKDELNNMTNENEKKPIGRGYSPYQSTIQANVANVSYKIPHWWWWASRDTFKKIGYDDLSYSNKGKTDCLNCGLCEYVALSNLLLFHELFSASGVFTEEQYKMYIEKTYFYDNKVIEESSPVFKNYSYSNPDNSLVKLLYNYTGKIQYIQQPYHFKTAVDKFMTNSTEKEKFDQLYKYGGFYQAWNNVKKGIPVVLAVAEMWGSLNHALLAYGYDDKSDAFLVNYLWGSNKTSKRLYSYYTYVWGSYFYALNPKSSVKHNPLKKVFLFKGKKYTGPEMTAIFNSLNKK